MEVITESFKLGNTYMWNSKFQIKTYMVHTQKLILPVIITVTKGDLLVNVCRNTVHCTAACLVNASLQQRSVHRSMTAHDFSLILRKSHVLWKLKRNAIKVEPPETQGEWAEQQGSQDNMSLLEQVLQFQEHESWLEGKQNPCICQCY